MGYREVTVLEIREVLLQWLDGAGKKLIARRQSLDVKTVRRYVKAAEKAGLVRSTGKAGLTDELVAEVVAALERLSGRPRGDAWALCLEHQARIAQLLAQRLKLTKARKLLAREGVTIPYATLHRFAVSVLDFGRVAPSIPVSDCGPGEELQVDTGWMTLLVPDIFGRRRRLRAWIFTSVRSRHRFVYPCFTETTRDAIEACEAAWEFFGGVFKVLIPDNTKAIVGTANPLSPVIVPAFLDYMQARGFHIDTTRVRSPKDKARVERAVQPVRDDCFAGETMHSLEEARVHARRWCLDDYGRRRHTRTQRLPLEHFEAEEKAVLLQAPTTPFDVPDWFSPIVARDGRVQVAKALYSVPSHLGLIGKKLRARADSQLVRIYFGTELVKTHVRQPPGGHSTDPNDYPREKSAYAMRDVDFLQREATRHGAAIGRFAAALLAGPLPWTKMRRVYALLGMTKRYGDARLEEACALALAAEMVDVHRLERMVKLGLPKNPVPPPQPASNVIPLARFLRPPSQYALPLASRERLHPEEKNE
jgi:transposase